MRQIELRRTAGFEAESEGRLGASDKLFLLGFLLVGVQAQALTQYYRWLVHSHRFFHAFGYIGMILILIGMSLSGANGERTDPLYG